METEKGKILGGTVISINIHVWYTIFISQLQFIFTHYKHFYKILLHKEDSRNEVAMETGTRVTHQSNLEGYRGEHEGKKKVSTDATDSGIHNPRDRHTTRVQPHTTRVQPQPPTKQTLIDCIIICNMK